MTKKVIIIGAGIGGLATANLLAKAGYSVSVYEKNSQPGGRAGTLEIDGYTFDTGPSWYLMPEVFAHYYQLLGHTVEKYLKLQRLNPAYKVFFEQQPALTISSDQTSDEATFEAIEPGAGRALRRYVERGQEIYTLALRHFLYTDFRTKRDLLHPEILRRGSSMLALALQPIDAYVSRFVQDQRLKQVLEYPTVFLGSSPFQTPALYSLMSALDFREGVFYPRGGIYKVIESLVTIGRSLGVTYHYNTPAVSIHYRADHADGIVLDDGSLIEANIVISNADLHYTETNLLAPSARSYADIYWKRLKPGPSALLMYLGVTGSLPNLEHHNLIFVDDWKKNFDDIYRTKSLPSPASIYICNPSKSDTSVAPTGNENLFVLVPLPAGIKMSESQEAKLADTYLDQIAAMTNTPDLKQRITVKKLFGPDDFETKFHAWQSTALGPSHILRQSAFFRTPNRSKKLKNLYYVGAGTMPGIGLPMCLISAELLYKQIIGIRKSGRVEHIVELEDA